MYAIVKTGGKQYRVEAGRTLEVERLPQGEGETVELGEVLMISADGGGVTIGTPVIDGARVLASVEAHGKAPKIVVYKYKNKVRTRKKTGHRQPFTRLTVEQILMPGEEAKAIERKPAAAEAEEFVPEDGNLDSLEEAAEAIAAGTDAPKAKKATVKAKAEKAAAKPEASQGEPAETFEPEDGNLDSEDEAAEAIVAAGAKAPEPPAKAAKATAKPKAEKAPAKAKAPAKPKAAKEEDKPKTSRRRLPLGRKKKETE